MTITKRGAWIGGGYRKGDTGTLGEDVNSDSDNRGWAIRSWKYELRFNDHAGAMKLDLPTFGDAMHNQVCLFQDEAHIPITGVIDALTGKSLMWKRILLAGRGINGLQDALNGIVAHESAYDLGAIGGDDPLDRGPTQNHLYPNGAINLSQAIRPALAIPRLRAQIVRLTREWDIDAAIVSWNCGEGGAEWWFENGKPATGSPTWWHWGDLGKRATEYLAAVRALA